MITITQNCTHVVLVVCCFLATYQMVSSVDKVSGSSDDLRKLGLAQRRALILTVVGNTPVSSSLLQRILEDGYLSEVNGWLSDILNGQVGKYCTSFTGCLIREAH